jgi:hypothetical protein
MLINRTPGTLLADARPPSWNVFSQVKALLWVLELREGPAGGLAKGVPARTPSSQAGNV